VAAEIVGEFQSQPEMTKGSGGIFVVTLDGKVIWDKKQTGRFPDPGEITDIVKERIGASKRK
jgi:selenoprotein W-related protein